MEKIKLKNNILRKVGTLVRSIHSASDIKYKELNLQKGQFAFLTRICETPNINLMELSNILTVDKSTTTKAIKKMVEAGYIEKTQDLNDKREFKLTPTKKGLEIYNFIIEEENRSIDICLEGFTDEEKNIINNLLERMSVNAKNNWNKLKK